MDTAGLVWFYLFLLQTLAPKVIGQNEENQCTTPMSFSAQTGTITSPLYPNQHGHNLECTYIITVSGATNITLTFQTFDLEYKLDFLRLGSGTEVGVDEFEREDYTSSEGFTGRDIDIEPVTIQGKSAWILFTTDEDIAHTGFSITYSTSVSCPPGYDYGVATGHCYKFVNTPSTWHAARLDCKSTQGSDLVAISNENAVTDGQEIAYISSEMNGVQFWTGLSDIASHEEWNWVPLKCERFTDELRWAPGNPPSQDGDQNCGILISSSMYSTKNCLELFPYVCEINAGDNRVDVLSVTASVTSVSSILVNWLLPIDLCEVIGYQVMYHRSDLPGVTSFVDVDSGRDAEQTITNLQSGTSYKVYVASRVLSGELLEYVEADEIVRTPLVSECVSNSCENGGTCVIQNNQLTCICPEGYDGPACETVYECASQPCRNGGTCWGLDNLYLCQCPPYFHGNNCELGPIDLSPCRSSPCQNGGACTNVDDGTYLCSCSSGWEGDNCEIATNNCDDQPCLNGGTCVNLLAPNNYVCICRDGFTGTNCEITINECASSPCFNGGLCIDQAGRYVCLCPSGFGGTRCETDIDECSSSPCVNGATCRDFPNGYLCSCRTGYTGTNCETAIDHCANGPCQNGGTCNGQTTGYTCTCLTGYVGTNCEMDARPCASNPCYNGGYCNNEPDNSYRCACSGYWSGDRCQTDRRECTGIHEACQNGGSCIVLPSQSYCVCLTGYFGYHCEEASTNCASQPCLNGGTCSEMPGSYYCSCPIPYTGERCAEYFDACSVLPCLNGGTCNNYMTHSTCSCPPMWAGVICQIYQGPTTAPIQTTTMLHTTTSATTDKETTEQKVTTKAATTIVTEKASTAAPMKSTEFVGTPTLKITTREASTLSLTTDLTTEPEPPIQTMVHTTVAPTTTVKQTTERRVTMVTEKPTTDERLKSTEFGETTAAARTTKETIAPSSPSTAVPSSTTHSTMERVTTKVPEHTTAETPARTTAMKEASTVSVSTGLATSPEPPMRSTAPVHATTSATTMQQTTESKQTTKVATTVVTEKLTTDEPLKSTESGETTAARSTAIEATTAPLTSLEQERTTTETPAKTTVIGKTSVMTPSQKTPEETKPEGTTRMPVTTSEATTTTVRATTSSTSSEQPSSASQSPSGFDTTLTSKLTSVTPTHSTTVTQPVTKEKSTVVETSQEPLTTSATSLSSTPEVQKSTGIYTQPATTIAETSSASMTTKPSSSTLMRTQPKTTLSTTSEREESTVDKTSQVPITTHVPQTSLPSTYTSVSSGIPITTKPQIVTTPETSMLTKTRPATVATTKLGTPDVMTSQKYQPSTIHTTDKLSTASLTEQETTATHTTVGETKPTTIVPKETTTSQRQTTEYVSSIGMTTVPVPETSTSSTPPPQPTTVTVPKQPPSTMMKTTQAVTTAGLTTQTGSTSAAETTLLVTTLGESQTTSQQQTTDVRTSVLTTEAKADSSLPPSTSSSQQPMITTTPTGTTTSKTTLEPTTSQKPVTTLLESTPFVTNYPTTSAPDQSTPDDRATQEATTVKETTAQRTSSMVTGLFTSEEQPTETPVRTATEQATDTYTPSLMETTETVTHPATKYQTTSMRTTEESETTTGPQITTSVTLPQSTTGVMRTNKTADEVSTVSASSTSVQPQPTTDRTVTAVQTTQKLTTTGYDETTEGDISDVSEQLTERMYTSSTPSDRTVTYETDATKTGSTTVSATDVATIQTEITTDVTEKETTSVQMTTVVKTTDEARSTPTPTVSLPPPPPPPSSPPPPPSTITRPVTTPQPTTRVFTTQESTSQDVGTSEKLTTVYDKTTEDMISTRSTSVASELLTERMYTASTLSDRTTIQETDGIGTAPTGSLTTDVSTTQPELTTDITEMETTVKMTTVVGTTEGASTTPRPTVSLPPPPPPPSSPPPPPSTITRPVTTPQPTTLVLTTQEMQTSETGSQPTSQGVTTEQLTTIYDKTTEDLISTSVASELLTEKMYTASTLSDRTTIQETDGIGTVPTGSLTTDISTTQQTTHTFTTHKMQTSETPVATSVLTTQPELTTDITEMESTSEKMVTEVESTEEAFSTPIPSVSEQLTERIYTSSTPSDRTVTYETDATRTSPTTVLATDVATIQTEITTDVTEKEATSVQMTTVVKTTDEARSTPTPTVSLPPPTSPPPPPSTITRPVTTSQPTTLGFTTEGMQTSETGSLPPSQDVTTQMPQDLTTSVQGTTTYDKTTEGMVSTGTTSIVSELFTERMYTASTLIDTNVTYKTDVTAGPSPTSSLATDVSSTEITVNTTAMKTSVQMTTAVLETTKQGTTRDHVTQVDTSISQTSPVSELLTETMITASTPSDRNATYETDATRGSTTTPLVTVVTMSETEVTTDVSEVMNVSMPTPQVTTQTPVVNTTFDTIEITATTSLVAWSIGTDYDNTAYVSVEYFKSGTASSRSGFDTEVWNPTAKVPREVGELRITDLDVFTTYRYRLLLEDTNFGFIGNTETQYFTTKAVPLPIDVRVSNIEEDSAAISWRFVDDPNLIGRVVFWMREKADLEPWWNETIPENMLPVIDLTDLEPDTTYQFQFEVVRAGDQITDKTPVYEFQTLSEPLLPENLQVINITTREATLTWMLNENSTLDGSVVQIKLSDAPSSIYTAEGSPWQNISFVGRDERSFTLTELTPGIEYNVRLLTSWENGTRFLATDVIVFETYGVSLPTDVTVNVTQETATIAWTLPDEGLVSKLILQYMKSGDDDFISMSLQPHENSVTLSRLAPDSTYTFNIKTISQDGLHQRTTENITFITQAELPPLPLPTNITVTQITNYTATISWINPEDTSMIGDIIVWYTSSDDDQWENVTVSPPTQSVRLSHLNSAQEYTVRVMVVSPDGDDSSTSQPITFRTSSVLPLPTSVTITNITSTTAGVSWFIDFEGQTDIGYITVEFQKRGDMQWLFVDVPYPRNSVTLTGLTSGETYMLILIIVSTDGVDRRSTTPISFETSPGVPSPTDLLISDVTDNGATVSWTIPEEGGPIGSIVVQYKTDDANEWTNLTATPNDTSVTLQDLEPSKEYTIRVVVISEDGSDTQTTDPVVFETARALPMPSDVIITDVSSNGALISWTISDEERIFIGQIVLQYNKKDGELMTMSLSVDSSSVQLSNLEPDTQYFFQLVVESVNATYNTTTPQYTFVTSKDLLLPGDIVIEDISDTSVTILWTLENMDQLGEFLLRYKTADGQWENVTLALNTNSLTLTNLDPDTHYTFHFIVVSSDGKTTVMSHDYSFSTSPAFLLPHDIAIVNKTTNAVTLTWTLPPESSVSTITVQYMQTGTGNWISSSDLNNDVTEFTIVGLSAKIEYTVRLISRNDDGSREESSDEIVFVTYAVPLPSDITVSGVSDDSATISWTIPEDRDLIGVIILQYKTGEDSDWTNETVSPFNSSVVLGDLEPNTDYHVRLVIQSQDGDDARVSTIISFATQTAIPVPHSLEFVNITTKQATVTWSLDDNTDLSGLVVQIKPTDGSADWTNASTILSPSETSFVIGGLSAKEDYAVRLLAIHTDGRMEYSDESVLTTEAVPLPVGINFGEVTDEGFIVSWTIPEDEDLVSAVIIQYKVDGDDKWQNMTVVPPTNSAQVSGLLANTEYSVRLMVVAQNGEDSRISPTTSLTTLQGVPIPHSLEFVNITTKQATVTWSLDDNTDLSGLVVQIKPTDGSSDWTNTSIILSPSETSFVIGGLSAKEDYAVRLLAIHTDGRMEYSDESVLTTEAVPLPVGINFGEVTDEGFIVSWTIPEDEDLVSVVIIQYKVDGDDNWQNKTVVPPTNSAQLSGLLANTEYSVRLMVVAQNGEDSRISPTTSLTTLQALPTATNVEAVDITVTSAKFTWDLEDPQNRVQSIVIQYKLAGDGSGWSNNPELAGNLRFGSVHIFTPNSTYLVRILTQGHYDSSSHSETISFRTAVVPSISHIQVQTRPFTATLTWTFDSDAETVGARVNYRKTGSADDWVKSSFIPAPGGTFVIEGLSPNTDYTYKLEIIAGTAGMYDETEPVTFTTNTMLLPYNVTIASLTDESVELTWKLDNDSNVGSLMVQYRENRERVARDTAEPAWSNSSALDPSTTSHKIVNLTAETPYNVRLYVVSSDGAYEDFTESTDFTTNAPSPLPVPSDIEISDIGPGGATISWPTLDPTGVDSVIVQYRPSDDPDADWVDAAVLPPDSNNFVLEGLSAGTSYEIRVVVVGVDGRTGESEPQVLQTESLPLPYDVKVIDITDNSATVLWQLDADVNVAGVTVQYTHDGDNWMDSSFVAVGNNSVTLSSLLPGTPYTYRLVVVATDQGTAVSPFYNFMTTGEPSPYNVRVKDITSSRATVQWDLTSNFTTDGAIVQYRTSNETWHNSSYVAMPNTSALLTDLYPKAKYIFRIIFFHKYSDEVTLTPAYFFETLALVPPLPFSLRVIAVKDRTATAIWYFNDTAGIDGYVIQYKTADEDWLMTSFLPVGTESVQLIQLTPGSQYVVMMKIVGVEGSITYTPFVLFTTETEVGVTAPVLSVDSWWFYLIVAIVIVVFVLLLCCILCMVACLRKKKYSADKEALTIEEARKADIPYSVEPSHPVTEVDETAVSIHVTKAQWWEIPRDKLVLIRLLAAGKFRDELWEGKVESFGEVADVGVKKLQDDDDDDGKTLLKQELDVLSRVGKHTNIVNLVGACSVNGPVMIVNDDSENVRLDIWLRNLDRLHDPVRLSVPGFNVALQVMPQLYDFAIDISKGMGYLASLKCVQHHLGARNVIVSANLVARVTDFAVPLPEESRYASLPRESQTPDDIRWMSHESLFYNNYTGKSNVWSFGVILWELATIGRIPYEETKLEELRVAIRAGHRLENPSVIPEDLFLLMSKCWAMEPKHRPSFYELTDRLTILQKSSELQTENMRKYVLESLSVLADNYTNWNDYQVTLLEDLILSNIEKPLPQSRLMAVQYAFAVFASNHVPSKYALLLASGDEVKIIRTQALEALRIQAKKADNLKADDKAKANLFPDFVSLVTFISLRAKDRITTKTIKASGPLGTHTIPFSPTAYEKMTIYLRMCLAYESRVNPNVATPEEMRLQGPLLSKRVNAILEEFGDSSSESPIGLYSAMLRQYVSAVGGPATMYRILELVAVASDRLAPEFISSFGRLKVFLHSENMEMRGFAAELYGVLLQYVDKNILLTEIHDMTQDLNHEHLEVQHGSTLALGHIIGKYLQKRRRLASHENIEHIGDSSNEDVIFTEAVKAIVTKLDSVVVMLVEAACTALGEIGRNGPLPLNNGEGGKEKAIEGVSKSEEETEVEEMTRLAVLQKVMGKVLSANDSIEEKAKAAEAVAFQTIGDVHYPFRNIVLKGLLESATIRVQPRTEHIALHFSIGDSLVTAIQGPFSPHGGDVWKVRMEDRGTREPYGEDLVWILNLLLEKYLDDVPADNTEDFVDIELDMGESFLAMGTMKEAICVWLLVLTANFRTHPAIESRLGDIQHAVTQMVNHWEETNVIIQLSPGIQHRLLATLRIIRPSISSITMGKMIAVKLTQRKQYHSEVRIQISRESSMVDTSDKAAEETQESAIEHQQESEPVSQMAEEREPGEVEGEQGKEMNAEETLTSFFGEDITLGKTQVEQSSALDDNGEEATFETFLGSKSMNIESSASEQSADTQPEETPLRMMDPSTSHSSFESVSDDEDQITYF